MKHVPVRVHSIWRKNKTLSSPLLSIPLELQLCIIEACDIPSQLALRIVNRHFHVHIKKPTLEVLLAAESTTWGTRRDLFSCMDCLRLRPYWTFSDTMTKGNTGKHGKEPNKRFCLECGLSPNSGQQRYTLGSDVKVAGVWFVVCKICSQFKPRCGFGTCGTCQEIRYYSSKMAIRNRYNYSDGHVDISKFRYDTAFWKGYIASSD